MTTSQKNQLLKVLDTAKMRVFTRYRLVVHEAKLFRAIEGVSQWQIRLYPFDSMTADLGEVMGIIYSDFDKLSVFLCADEKGFLLIT